MLTGGPSRGGTVLLLLTLLLLLMPPLSALPVVELFFAVRAAVAFQSADLFGFR